MRERQQSSTAHPIPFLMIDSADHVAGKTGLSPTVTLSKDGGTFAAAAGAVTELTNGWYVLAGNATDRGTLGTLAIHASATGADPFDGMVTIVPWDPFDANMGLARLDAAVTTRATPAQVRTQVADVLTVDTIAELAQGVPPVSPTVVQALALMYMSLRNQITEDGSFLAFHNDAGTVIVKATTADNGSVFARGK